MSGPAAPSPAPSVFLSYASENRAAVRQIRDALLAAGIEAWYDENELAGGEAWDQKIRRQIRDCTYFMPVISAASNARLEGYFRREWRLAIERTLDMADDVVFLLPVALDDTPDAGARVPEKFLTVQWLRLPGGAITPGFQELARRLAAGGAQRLHLAPSAARSTGVAARPPQYLPPLLEDPGPPKGWWRTTTYFWAKLPRFVRFCLWCIFLIFAMSMCGRLTDSDHSDSAPRNRRATNTPPATPSTDAEDGKAIAQAVQDTLQTVLATRNGIAAARRPPDLDLLAFEGSEQASKIQQDLFTKLVTTSGVKTHLNVGSAKGTPVERARANGARFVLNATADKLEDGSAVLRVKLERVADGVEVWTDDVKADEDPQTASARIYAGTLPFLLKKD